jgi:hypothetical protein
VQAINQSVKDAKKKECVLEIKIKKNENKIIRNSSSIGGNNQVNFISSF